MPTVARPWSGLLALVLIVVMLLEPRPAHAMAPTEPAAADLVLPTSITSLYFPETGHHVSGSLLRYWWERGQLPIFGFPLTEELSEAGRIVQYFERARLELYPELLGTPYAVQPSLLGRQLAPPGNQPAFVGVGPIGENPDRDYFESTRHTLSFAFKRFWEANGGLLIFGYPISEEFEERGQIVQYFERARFEYVPNRPDLPGEVQLGQLGRQAAGRAGVALSPVSAWPAVTNWTPGLAAELAQRSRAERIQRWLATVAQPVTPYQAVITVPSVEQRSAPTTASTLMMYSFGRHLVRVVGTATGEPLNGDEGWVQLANGAYLPAASVAPFSAPAPPRTWAGRWIDVNLSTFYATGYQGATPLYSALVTAGRDNRTPVGVFGIQRRIRSETMNSATVGFPPGHPEYYYLPNVEYVQYITGRGHALHGNYWTHPARFGRFSSNGCIGLLNADAAWFWSFAGPGTLVHIHY